MNQKRFRRLYREEGMAVRKPSGRKRALGMRSPIALPSRANDRWSLDFVSDSFTDGRRFRVLQADFPEMDTRASCKRMLAAYALSNGSKGECHYTQLISRLPHYARWFSLAPSTDMRTKPKPHREKIPQRSSRQCYQNLQS